MKNIVLLSDGTGNSAAKVWRTNVWRLFQSLDLKGSNQIANKPVIGLLSALIGSTGKATVQIREK